MKKTFKTRVLPVLMAMLLCLGCLPMVCFAEDASTPETQPSTVAQSGKAAVSVSSASGKAGDEVTVNVNLTSNPGVVAMDLGVSYDPKQLELVSASDTGVLKGFNSPTPSGSSGSYKLNWEDGLKPNNSGTGTVATLTFRLKEDCDTASVNVSGEGVNYDLQTVGVSGGKGTITNTNPTTTTTKPTTTKPTTTKPTTTKASTTKATTKAATTRPYTTSAFTRSSNEANTYPVDFEIPTEAENTTELTSMTEVMIWTMEETTEETTIEETTEAQEESGSTLSRTKLILIVLMACFAIIGIAVIISMVRKSRR